MYIRQAPLLLIKGDVVLAFPVVSNSRGPGTEIDETTGRNRPFLKQDEVMGGPGIQSKQALQK